jgi:hypothetical protein
MRRPARHKITISARSRAPSALLPAARIAAMISSTVGGSAGYRRPLFLGDRRGRLRELAVPNVQIAGGELGDHGSHGFDLAFEPVYELGAVASVDEQQFAAWGEEAAALLDPQSSAGALGVDYGDATGADCDVVDVRAPAAWDPPVVQQHDVAAVQVPGELAGDADLFIGALLPRAGALRISDQSRKGLAERAEARSGALLALRASALVLTDGASACRPPVHFGRPS